MVTLTALRPSMLRSPVAVVVALALGCGSDATGDGDGGSAGTSGGADANGSQVASTGGPGEGTASGNASTGAQSTTGGGVACTPEAPFDGEPIDGEASTWTWVEVPDAVCRDGSQAGFGVRLNPASDRLVIYFEGGGACFNALTCGLNPWSFGASSFAGWKDGGGRSGVFDAENEDNPLRDWNVVFVPYCTGDVHAGDATDVDVPGPTAPKAQSFVGYRNVGLFLDRIVPTFANVTKVLVTGSSAGGFGAAYNYDRIAQAFCPTPAVLIDDAGPAMADDYLAPCLQTRWRELWGLDATMPAGCPECSGPDGGGLVNTWGYLAERYPATRLGLLSTDQDAVIRLFYGFGDDDCANIDGLLPLSMSGERFAEGLDDLRQNVFTHGAVWSTYFAPGTSHTFLAGSTFTTTVVDDVPLTEWVGAMVDGGSPGNVGP